MWTWILRLLPIGNLPVKSIGKFLSISLLVAVILAILVLIYTKYSNAVSSARELSEINTVNQIDIRNKKDIIDQQQKALQDWKSAREEIKNDIDAYNNVSIAAQKNRDLTNDAIQDVLSKKDSVNGLNDLCSDINRMLQCVTSKADRDCTNKNRDARKSNSATRSQTFEAL